jgi:hypothetical protein
VAGADPSRTHHHLESDDQLSGEGSNQGSNTVVWDPSRRPTHYTAVGGWGLLPVPHTEAVRKPEVTV